MLNERERAHFTAHHPFRCAHLRYKNTASQNRNSRRLTILGRVFERAQITVQQQQQLHTKVRWRKTQKRKTRTLL